MTGPAEAADVNAYATLDLERAQRRGYPEAVYCEAKTPEQVAGIARVVRDRADGVTLFTRASAEHAEAIHQELPDAAYDEQARLLAWPPDPPSATGGLVVVVAAGTSDLPVAREALLTARYLGRAAELVVDVGVAGLHRILARLETLRAARWWWSLPEWTVPCPVWWPGWSARRWWRCPPRSATVPRSPDWPRC